MASTKTRSYRRRRLTGSPCRKKRSKTCRRLSNCNWASGKKRSFCRRKNNKSRRRKSRRSKSAWPSPLYVARKALS